MKVNLLEKFALFHDHWSPKVVGELNGQQVKLVKFQGEFVWHHHDHEDELFLPVAEREVEILLFEPTATINTGSAEGEKTVLELERL